MHSHPAVFLCDLVGDSGGTERYLERVLPELRRAGLDMTLLARTVTRPGAFGVPAIEIGWSGEHDPPSAAAAQEVGQYLGRLRPQVVFTSNVFDSEVLRTVRSHAPRWLARIHDHRPFCPNGDRVYPQFSRDCTAPMGSACKINAVIRGCVCGPHAETYRRIERRTALRDVIVQADAVLVSSGAMIEECKRNGVDAGRIVLTQPPLPRDAYGTMPVTMPRRAVLFAGRLTPQKGLPSLMRALARIAPAHRPTLVVAGSGDDERAARDLAQRLHIEVEWLGWLDQAAFRRAIDTCAVVAVPSLWPEPFGLVGIEAQARGRPVVAYDVGGVRDWLDGAGIPVPRGDERVLARAIEHALDERHWIDLARVAFEKARTYDMERHVERMLSLLAPHEATERMSCVSS
ncbi:MAG: glycosyltransferase family 4 protein [Vulcanimicrobiaceae bacterium]